MVITGLDFIVIAVMLISALLAMVRGLTREVLSILSWIAAAVATLYFFPRFQEDMRQMLQPNWLADISLALGVFIVTLLIVSFITMRISDFILDSRIGAVDRTLGFVFGLGRGLLIVVVAFMFFVWLVPPDNQPSWIAQARSKPLLERTGNAIIALLPEDPEKAIVEQLRERAIGRDGTDGEAPPADPGGTTPTMPDAEEQSYAPGDRQGLNQLLESTRARTGE